MARKLPQRSQNLNRTGSLKWVYGLIVISLIGLAGVYWGILDKPKDIIKLPPNEVYDSPSDTREQTDTPSYKVTRVIDGDTFEIEIPNYGTDRIRVKKIDTPEVRKAACTLEKQLANEATELGVKLLDGQMVKLKLDAKRDRYGRALASVTLANGEDYGQLMLDSGLAVVWPREYDWCRLGRVKH